MSDRETQDAIGEARARQDAAEKRSADAISEMSRLGEDASKRIAADDSRRAADDERRSADDGRRSADDERRSADDKRREVAYPINAEQDSGQNPKS